MTNVNVFGTTLVNAKDVPAVIVPPPGLRALVSFVGVMVSEVGAMKGLTAQVTERPHPSEMPTGVSHATRTPV